MSDQEQDKALENFRDGMHAWSAAEYERLCTALRSGHEPSKRTKANVPDLRAATIPAVRLKVL